MALSLIDSRYQLFPRLKYGPGRTTTYRPLSRQELDTLRRTPGAIIWENSRYDATYVVDRFHLDKMMQEGKRPVVHLGQPEAVTALRHAVTTAFISVNLTCPRNIAEQRIKGRDTGDITARLAAYDETAPLTCADLTIDTSHVEPTEAAIMIDLTCSIAVLQ